jgi:hypothetical protein
MTYDNGAMKRMQFYWQLSEVEQGRENVSDSARPERQPEIGIDEILAHMHECNPYATAQVRVYLLGVSPQIVVTQKQEGLGMEFFRPRCVPHQLALNSKVMFLRVAKMMAQQLLIHAKARFQY